MSGSPDDPFLLDRERVRRSFDRASSGYDRAAVVQTLVREELLERLLLVRLDPAVIVDAGSGTGHASRELKKRFGKASVVALDLSASMLAQAQAQQRFWRRFERVCADASRLPFADASVDVLFSNLMLQWCNDLDSVFAEFRRVLKPEALLTFSTFGPDTLYELRRAFREADGNTHVNRFIDMHDIGDALVRAGFAEPVLDVERYTLTYDDVTALMRDLKAIGAHNATLGRPAGLMGRGRLARMAAAYEPFRRDGKLPATYEVVFGQAWGTAPRVRSGDPREVHIDIGSIGGRRAPGAGGAP